MCIPKCSFDQAAPHSRAKQGADALPSCFSLFIVFLLYSLINALTQFCTSATADLDQAEQFVFSQDWRMGYSDQPPLYTWLVRGVFAITTGPSLASLICLKSVLLSALAGLLIAIGKQFSFTRQQHLITLMSLAFIPQIIWESQRDLTHSVLVTVLAAATLLQVVRTQRRPVALNYIIMGLLVGLGLLSKYNYALFLLALLCAAVLAPQYRHLIRSPRMVLSLAVALAVTAPHLAWALNHVQVVTASIHKLKIAHGFYLFGFFQALSSALSFLGPLWAASLFLRAGGQGRTNRENLRDNQFVTALFLSTLALVAVFVLSTGVQYTKSRWYEPLLFYVPLLIALRVGPSQRNVKPYCLAGAAVAILVALALPLRTILAEGFNHTSRPNIPYPKVLSALATRIETPAHILAENNLIGGNARPYFKNSRIATPKYDAGLVQLSEATLVLCEAKGLQSATFRAWLLKQGLDPDLLAYNQMDAPYYFTPKHNLVLYWALSTPRTPVDSRPALSLVR